MFVEWLIIVVALAAAGIMILPKRITFNFGLFAAIAVGVSLLPLWLWQRHLERRRSSRAELTANLPHLGRPEDYAGSETCRTCHPAQYDSWHQSFHRTMTQTASRESVRGLFDGVTLALDGQEYRLAQNGEEFWVDMVDPDWTRPSDSGSHWATTPGGATAPRVRRRISMVTGSHHMQAYWFNNPHGNQQRSFPFTYLFEQERWVPRRTVFLLDPKPIPWRQVWNVGCIECHSTGGQPRQLGDPASFDTRVGELGIACEACHGPAGEHTRLNLDPRRRYQLHLHRQGDPTMVNPARLSPKRASEVCGACHSVHAAKEQNEWLQTGHTYRPGEELESKMKVLRRPQSYEMRRSMFWSDGMIRVSGREYNGLIKSPCFLKGELSCLSCHSMHQSSPTNQLAKAMESNAACLPCHQTLAENLTQHSHHSAESTGSLCYNCHMPYTSYGLMKALRSHQISNPSTAPSVQAGRPNACNLCHLDKSLGWTAEKLSAWYKIPHEELPTEDNATAASILWLLKGDAGQRALLAWHMGWKPARDTSDSSWFAPYLAILLQDPYPAVRYIAGRSLKRLAGFQNLSYDYVGPPDEQARAGERVRELWTRPAQLAGNRALLLDEAGHLDNEAVLTLLKSRNDRVVELNE